jgi:hypothetical protein
MSKLELLQSELTLKLSEIDAICEGYGYDAIPTLLLRHSKGASSSILLGNDSLEIVVLTIAELGDVGNESSQSPTEAALTLFKGGI